jgi:dihydroorotate dehydrogenase (NAD+) catalytic subunit
MIDTTVNLGGLAMRTPVTTASGTFGYGTEYFNSLDYSKLGAVTVKGIRLDPWNGNPMPRHAEVFGGLVNAIGLQGPGIDAFVKNYIPQYVSVCGSDLPMIVNIWGGSIEEYAEVAKRLTGQKAVGAIECNVSCPNVKEGGHTFGQDPQVLARLVKAVRESTDLPLIVKLAPNVPDIKPYVAACEDNGADALALINTIPAMVIDIETRRPVLGNKTGGLSGPAIKPVAVRMVYQVYEAVKIPIVGMGGVESAEDVLEFMLAGATAVEVGAANLVDPMAAKRIIEDLPRVMKKYGIENLSDIIGGAH